jgi:hypothetical protein
MQSRWSLIEHRLLVGATGWSPLPSCHDKSRRKNVLKISPQAKRDPSLHAVPLRMTISRRAGFYICVMDHRANPGENGISPYVLTRDDIMEEDAHKVNFAANADRPGKRRLAWEPALRNGIYRRKPFLESIGVKI